MLTGRLSRAPAVWLYVFLVLQFLCQLALLAPLGSARIGFRILTFFSSIALLVFLPFSKHSYPHRRLGITVIVITALGILHPQLNNPVAGIAAIAMCVAIWSPILWVDRIQITPEVFAWALLVMWTFHTASAIAGVLQVYDPDRFAPNMEFYEKLAGESVAGMQMKLDDGRKIFRPFGLTDSPGGAALSGSFAATVGINLLVSRGSLLIRAAGAASSVIGMFCLYMCQIRSILIVTCVGFVFMAVVNLARGHFLKSAMLMGAIIVAVLAGFVWATALGSDSVTNRLETLREDDAATVYYSNRGHFLESTLENELVEYPFGAGLGRWGMINMYFGDRNNPDSQEIWVEIQATGWICDGGLPLLAVGYTAVIAATFLSIRIAIRSASQIVSESASVVAVMNVTALMTTLNYPLFISQGGMIFWFLNAALFGSSVAKQSSPTSGS